MTSHYTMHEDVNYLDVDQFTINVVKHDDTHTVTGDGIFDKLMITATQHLLAQYEANRIRGEQYTNAYIHIYEVTLEAALRAWLTMEKTNEEMNLLRCQAKLACKQAEHEGYKIAQTVQNTALLKEQTDHETSKRLNTEQNTKVQICQEKLICKQFEHEGYKIGLTEAQTENVQESTAHEKLKEDVTKCQKLLVCHQADHELHKIDLTDAQESLTTNQATHETHKQDLTDAQKTLTTNQATHETTKQTLTASQKLLTDSQTTHEGSKKLLTDAQIVTEGERPHLVDCQATYFCAQSETEAEKTALTEAQTALTKAQILSEGAKANLYKRQTEGFADDFIYKIYKANLDLWSVGFSVAKDAFGDDNGIPDSATTAGLNSFFKELIYTSNVIHQPSGDGSQKFLIPQPKVKWENINVTDPTVDDIRGTTDDTSTPSTTYSDSYNIKLMDIVGAASNKPLNNQPYKGFKFTHVRTGVTNEVTFVFRSADAALYTGASATYATLLSALRHAIADYEAANNMSGIFIASLTDNFTASTLIDGMTYSGTGKTILLTSHMGNMTNFTFYTDEANPDLTGITANAIDMGASNT